MSEEAREIVTNAIKRRVADGSVIGKPWELIDAIASAIDAAFHRGVDAAKEALRTEETSAYGGQFKAAFITAIARKCGSDPSTQATGGPQTQHVPDKGSVQHEPESLSADTPTPTESEEASNVDDLWGLLHEQFPDSTAFDISFDSSGYCCITRTLEGTLFPLGEGATLNDALDDVRN